MKDVAAVIPTLNEAGCIGTVVRELRSLGVGTVIVADGGSKDQTRAIALEAGARVVDAGKGYGRACLAGALAADAEFVVFMDGDGADDPSALPLLLTPVRSGCFDFALGSRWRGRREKGSMSLHQILAGLGAGLAIRLLFGVAYTDMCAFRVIRRDTLLGLGMSEMTYGWNLEMQLLIAKAGLKVIEIPVNNRRRIAGTSNVAGLSRGASRRRRRSSRPS